jgi:hypothetical protein
MSFELFTEVVLDTDIPEKGLRKGDVATVVERHAVADREAGYSLEVFNALGDTIAVLTLPESQIKSLTGNDVFTVRSVAAG